MPGPRFLLGVGMPASRCLPGVGIQRGQVYQRSGAGIPEELGRYTRGVGQVYQRSGAGIPEGSQGWMGMYTHTQHMVPGCIPDGGWGGYVYPPPHPPDMVTGISTSLVLATTYSSKASCIHASYWNAFLFLALFGESAKSHYP